MKNKQAERKSLEMKSRRVALHKEKKDTMADDNLKFLIAYMGHVCEKSERRTKLGKKHKLRSNFDALKVALLFMLLHHA